MMIALFIAEEVTCCISIHMVSALSCGRLLSQANLLITTAELNDLEEDLRTCFAIEICCFAAANPSAFV